jgi:hypothetical protein
MPIALAAGIGLVGSVASAVIGSKAAKKAAAVQADAAASASRQQMKMYEMQRADLAPYAKTGKGAMESLADLYGLPTDRNPNGGQAYNPDAIEAFKRAPDYQVAYKAGVDGINSADAANRSLLSGAHMKRLVEHAGNFADQRFGTYLSRMFSLAGMGQNAAAQQGSGALQTGNSIAANTMNGAAATASGIASSANQWGGAINNTANNLGYFALRGAYDTPSSVY